jgi:hypothetical protein
MVNTKEKPLRILQSPNSTKVYLVEWLCPKCEGKGWPSWSPLEGCSLCKGKGVIDGPTKVGYDEARLIQGTLQKHYSRIRNPKFKYSIYGTHPEKSFRVLAGKS